MKRNECAVFADMMFEYIEYKRGTAENDEKVNILWESFERHLSECESCRRELEECEKLLTAVAGSAEEVPEGLHERITDRVKFDAKLYRKRRFTRIMGGAAAVFVLTVGVFSAFRLGLFDSVNNDCAVADGIAGNAPSKNEFSGNADCADGAENAVSPEADIDYSQNGSENEFEKPCEVTPSDTEMPSGEDEGIHEDAAESEAPEDVRGETADPYEFWKEYLASSLCDGGTVFVIDGDGKLEAFSSLKDKFSDMISDIGDGFFVISLTVDEKELTAKVESVTDSAEAEFESLSQNGNERCAMFILK